MAPSGVGSLSVLVAAVFAAEVFHVTADRKNKEDLPVSSTIPVPIPVRHRDVSPEVFQVMSDGKNKEDLPVSITIPVPIPVRHRDVSPEVFQVMVDGKNNEDLPVNGTIPVPIPVRYVSRIIGGKPTSTKEFPWQALASSNAGRCGASIISTTWILCAAHCFAIGDPDILSERYVVTAKSISIVAGLTERSQIHSDPDVQIRTINEDEIEDHLFVHPDFKKGGFVNNDIALIKLKNPLTLSEKVRPIKLADTTDFIPGKEAITSGWGRTFNNDFGGPDILQYVNGLNLISKEDCKKVYGRFVTDKNICHKTENKNICNGDSGGAVITGIGSSNGPPYVQIGINSFVWGGAERCEAHQPGVFTDVAMLRPWIDSTTSDPCLLLGGIRIAGQCLIFNEEPKTWAQAVSSCEAKGQQLAVLQDPVAVHVYLQNNYDGERFWLGGSDINLEDTWTWINGQSMASFPWGHLEPNDWQNNEDCLEWSYKYHYNDARCTKDMRYICEHV